MAVLLQSSLSGCSVVTIKNQTWFGSLQKQGAAQFDTLDDASAVLTLDQFMAKWEDATNPMIATYASNFEDVMTNYQTLCSRYPSECTIQGVTAANRFLRNVSRIKRHANGEMVDFTVGDFSGE